MTYASLDRNVRFLFFQMHMFLTRDWVEGIIDFIRIDDGFLNTFEPEQAPVEANLYALCGLFQPFRAAGGWSVDRITARDRVAGERNDKVPGPARWLVDRVVGA